MKDAFSRLATAKAALLMTGSTYVSFISGLIVSALIARAIGPEDFGRYAYVVWISGLLVMIGNNGLNTTGIRFISESLGRDDKPAAEAVHGWLLRGQYLCLAVTVVGFLVTLPFSVSAGWHANISLFVAVVLISMAAKTLYLFDISMAKGHGQYAIEARTSMAVSVVNLLCVLAMFSMHAPLAAYLALFTVASIAYGVMARSMLKKRHIVAGAHPIEASTVPRLRKHLFWTVLLAVAGALGNKTSETYLLSVHFGAAAVGFYTIAAGLTRGGVELLSSGLNSVLMPLMGHAYGAGGTSRVNAILADSVRYFSVAGLLLAGVGFLWAEVVIALMYGAPYQSAVPVFQVMALVAGVTLSQGAFGALLSTTDHQRIRAFVAVLSVVVSVVTAVLLVPPYGLAGAVAAHAISTVSIFLLVGGGVVRVFGVSLPWRELTRLLLAAAAAAAVAAALLWSGDSLWIHFAAGLLYAIVFLGATIAFRAWPAKDIDHLMPLATRYPALLGSLLPAISRWLDRPAPRDR